ncbi:MAG: PilW family protein [Burkholderiales bacterium]
MTYMTNARSTRLSNRGIGLVELMVGMVIALLSMIVIMQVFAQSEGQKRTTNFGSDAQTNGAVALFTIERDARLAGFGLTSTGFLNCPTIAVWRDSAGLTEQVSFAPFQINPPAASVLAGDANTDVITLAFGVADNIVEGTSATQGANPAANFKVGNRAGFSMGDLVVGVQNVPGVGMQCTMHEITNVPGGQCNDAPNGGSDELIHNTGNYKNYGKGCSQGKPEFNRPGGIPGVLALDKANGAKLFNLGALPINLAYAIRGNNLTVCDRINTTCTVAANFTPIASDIVSLRAVYGKDTTVPPDGEVDVWDRVTPINEIEWQQVAAARIEIVARSAIKERVNAAGVCDITANSRMPDGRTWLGEATPGAGIDLSATDPEWGCYRYKLFQTVVPFRNLIWRP